MKIYIALLLLIFVSCNKTKIDSPIIGKWSLRQVYISTGAGGVWEPAITLMPVSLRFYSDGSFSQENSQLTGYNHFQLVSSDSLKLYNTYTQKSLVVRYSLNNTLTFYYSCIEGCGERYWKE